MSDIDETTGRLSPPHLQMLWDSAEFVGPGDVRDLVAEVRRLRHERDQIAAALARIEEWTPHQEQAVNNGVQVSGWMVRVESPLPAQAWALVLAHNVAVAGALCESFRHGAQYGAARVGPPQIVRDLFTPGWDIVVDQLQHELNTKDRALAEACDWIEHDLDNHEAMVEREMTHDREDLGRWRQGLSARRRDGIGPDDPLDVIESLRHRINDLTADVRVYFELRAELEKLVGSHMTSCKTPIGMARVLAEQRDALADENARLKRERDSLRIRHDATKAALDCVDRERVEAVELLALERRSKG